MPLPASSSHASLPANPWPVAHGAREGSAAILDRIYRSYHRGIDLTLRPAYRALLAKLGNPQEKLPPVLHVAGTNGKGSTVAFARAMLEAAGWRVHTYTSPHLVTFHERIRIAGRLIEEDELTDILELCEREAEPGKISFFEMTTAAAFLAFARHPADAALIEVGLGGRLDSTNVITRPAVTAIARISYDHREYLGASLAGIAREKAGIMKPGVPCYAMEQPDEEARAALRAQAAIVGAPLLYGGQDWQTQELDGGAFRFNGPQGEQNLPPPALAGAHQIMNAGLAIAALGAMPLAVPLGAMTAGLRGVDWPARLQRLVRGPAIDCLPEGWELWLDGGHNDSAGTALAAELGRWRQRSPKPLYLVFGMLATRAPHELLGPMARQVDGLRAVPIPGADGGAALSLSAAEGATAAMAAGIRTAAPATDVVAAVRQLVAAGGMPGRILICGSLYLAGAVLQNHG
ncbi:MAG: bifunctional folylpolyglutamate synthase/dihydrofolate synthase [Alphaproteobacteria bacterium]|nr:bifunctional folylpolyglutamate synthase/dihydrofolate synthase [Alphaproteobacteria bacterium]